VVLDSEAPTLLGRRGDALLDALVFAGNQTQVRDVFVGGRRVVEEGHHIAEHDVLARFRGAMKTLLD
jgi:formimidoylglutamate deiminase